MATNKQSTVDIDEYEELQEELALANSRLDRITGMTKAIGDDATTEQVQEVLDDIYTLAAPDDEFEQDGPDSGDFDEEDED
jgi:hypothetical protein